MLGIVSGSWLAWIALALVLGTGALWFRRAFAVAIPENRGGFMAAFAIGLALGVAALVQSPGTMAGIAAGFACAGGAIFLGSVAIGAQKGGSGAFQLGAPVPDFSAPDEDGNDVQLSSLSGVPLLLKFFRGHW